MSPFEALFGKPMQRPSVLLTDDGGLAADISQKLKNMFTISKYVSEEEEVTTTASKCVVCSEDCSEKCDNCNRFVHKNDCAFEGGLCSLCKRTKDRNKNQQHARKNLAHQAKQMKITSDRNQSKLERGDNVLINLAVEDRFSFNQRNIIAVVVETRKSDIDDTMSYKLAVQQGRIEGAFARHQLIKCTENCFLRVSDCRLNPISLRAASRLHSKPLSTTFQGYCTCKLDCLAFKCRCKADHRDCTVKCHPGRRCKNVSTPQKATTEFCSCKDSCLRESCPCQKKKQVCHVKCHSPRTCSNTAPASSKVKGCLCNLGCEVGKCRCQKQRKVCTSSCHEGKRCGNIKKKDNSY